MADTLSSVRTAVLLHLGDSTNTIWTNAEINAYIKEGYDTLVYMSQCLWVRSYSNDVAATATYTLPTDFLLMDRVQWNWRRIPPLTQRELRHLDARYRTTQGEVLAYSVDLDGVLTLRKYPVPSATPTAGSDTNNTRLEYFRRGAALALDTTGFDIPDRYVKYIRHFAMWKALEREGKGQDLEMADHYELRFNAGVARMMARREAVRAVKETVLGGNARRFAAPPRPRLPWEFGREVEYMS